MKPKLASGENVSISSNTNLLGFFNCAESSESSVGAFKASSVSSRLSMGRAGAESTQDVSEDSVLSRLTMLFRFSSHGVLSEESGVSVLVVVAVGRSS
jgi:hypothetical protein